MNRSTKITIMALLCRRIKLFTLSKLGIRLLCLCLVICLSKISTREGSTRITVATPSTTPLAMTMPMSRPSVSRMTHRARKPATVVRLEEDRERKAATTACAMASRSSS